MEENGFDPKTLGLPEAILIKELKYYLIKNGSRSKAQCVTSLVRIDGGKSLI